MLKFGLITLAVVLVGFLIVAAFQPSDYRISRSATIAAPPEVVFAHVNDLHKFQTWSPFAKMDLDAKTTFSGPSSGRDASLAWVGKKTGEGRMTITDSRPSELVRFNMEFIKPMASSADAEFIFVPEGGQTRATWTMSGKNGYLQKAIGIFANMDRIIGDHFAQGLADLGEVARKPALPE